MRIDDFLSTVGLIKRRTIAKELGQNGLITVNNQKVKPAYQVKENDIIEIKGSRGFTAEIIKIPSGSVPKEQRHLFFNLLNSSP
jgi:ribosomal 50S subunit-recycling heat shock protein